MLAWTGPRSRSPQPVLTVQEFQRVQNALSARSTSPARTRRTTPLLGVVKCGRCGRNASRVGNTYKGKHYQYYRCNSDSAQLDRCRGSAHENQVIGIVERAFLTQLADVRVQEREWHKGDDHTAELEHVRCLPSSLENEKRTSTDWDEDDEREYQTSKQHYRRRIKKKALAMGPAGWVTRLTEHTYGQQWAAADEDSRRKLMLNAGMIIKIMGKNHFALTLPATTIRAGYPAGNHTCPRTISPTSPETPEWWWISSSPKTSQQRP